jgi:formate hydrogenlyase subunit 6/NADH:ubiquinone oxidoreductase subunit I
MVGYCVYCGLCEEACPADIPLKTIYKMVANVVNEQQGYLIQGMAPRGEATKEEKDRREAVSGSMFRDDVGSSASGDPQ